MVDRRELKVHAGPGQGRYDQCDELSCVISHGKRFGAVTAIVGWMEVDEGIRIRARAIDVHSGVILKQAERKSVLSSSLAMSTLLDSLSADFAWQGRTFGSPPEEEPSRSRRIDSLRHERQRRVRAGTISSGLAMAGLLVAGTIQMKHENDCGTSVGEGGTLASPQGCEDPSRAPQILAVASAGFALYGIMQFVGLARLDDEIAKLSSAGKQVIPRIQLDPLGSRFALGWDTRF